MNTLEAVVTAALWAVAAYRVAIVVRGYSRQRLYLAVTVAAMALTCTTHFAGAAIDQFVGIPNAGSLTARLALIVSLTALQLWTVTVDDQARSVAKRVLAAGVAAVVALTSWSFAPLHDATVVDHATLPQTPALLTYTVGLYLYFAWVAADLGLFAARRARRLRRDDQPATFALASVTIAASSGTVTMLAWTVHVLANSAGIATTAWATLGRLLMPLTLVSLGVGLAALPVARTAAAARDLVRVTPAWRSASTGVRLDSRTLLAPETVLTRRLIELEDAGETPDVDQLDQDRVDQVSPSPIADLIGRVLSPFPVLIALIGWTAAATTPTTTEAAQWAGLACGLTVGVPFLALIVMRVTGKVTDRQVVHRTQRHALFLIAFLSTVAAAAALHFLEAPRGLVDLVVAMLALLTVMATLTRWKPSMHLAVSTGAIVALAAAHGPPALWLALLLPAIAWARIRSGRHTPAQVAVGAVVGVGVTSLALGLL